MRAFQRYICAALAAGLVLIPVTAAFAEPMIMPGAVDITDATSPEDYFPEIETVSYYDENGLPFDENGSMLGAMWYYDPDMEMYCKFNNEGQVSTQKEYPYADTGDFGELHIQLSYTRSYALNPEGKEAVLYLMNSEYFLYAIRIPCTREEDVISLPAGEYTPYAVQSYDYEDVIIDCPNLPTGCYVPAGEAGHLDLALELTYTYDQLHFDWSDPPLVSDNLSNYEAATRESMTFTDADGNQLTTAASSAWATATSDNAAGSTSSAAPSSVNRTQDSLSDYVAAENETDKAHDEILSATVFLALVIGVVVLLLAVILLVVYIIVLQKKKKR